MVLPGRTRSIDTHWEDKFGKNRDVRDHYNELILTMEEGDRTFEVIARSYDDGVAFRLFLPRQAGMDSFTVIRDATEFTFPGDVQVWAGWNNHDGPSRPEGGFIGSQEWQFKPTKLSELNPNFKFGLPFLVQTPAAYVAITESDLLDWAGIWLAVKAGSQNTLEAQLAPPIPAKPWSASIVSPADSNLVIDAPSPTGEVPKGLVAANTPNNSPWRTFIIGRKPYELIQSDLVLNLATPSQLADISWVKPGMSAWDPWWSGGGEKSLSTLEKYIDLAADMGWPYQLSECIDNSILPELIAYGRKRGVRIWLWFHSNDFIDTKVAERDFPMYAKWGIAGMKIDFIDRDDQFIVNWYEEIARIAAENHLMIDFHGAFKPTGLERTWPNQLTREGIQGNEYNKVSARETPEHRATLPFTRALAGPADYTPGGFLNRQPSQFQIANHETQVQSTRAAELAMFILIQSSLEVACDSPDHYRDKDGNFQPGMDFLKGLPTVWDETRGLAGEVGKYVIEARRHGTKWYVAAITNQDAHVLPLPLKFLGPGEWRMTIWEDAPDSDQQPEHLIKEETAVHSSDVVQLKFANSGGAVAIFSAAK
jgi:alpha-glucosidase